MTYDRFERKMLEVLETGEYAPDSSDVLLQAFRVLDTEKQGFIPADRLVELLTSRGTGFREKEIESACECTHAWSARAGDRIVAHRRRATDFLAVAKDLETGNVYYEDYVALLTEKME